MSNNDNCILLDNLNKVQIITSMNMNPKMSRLSVLMLLNGILMGVVVVIGAYAPRYRRHPVIGAVFLGATALFLPILTTTVDTAVTTADSTSGSVRDYLINIEQAFQHVGCSGFLHLFLVFAWSGVMVVIGINTSAVVAGDPREGRNVAPPIVLLVKASWSTYLTFSTLGTESNLNVQLFVIVFAKLLLKYAAFYMARRSFALGRSPRLIAGYMTQLQQQPVHEDEHTDTAPPPPALIVMGEDKVKVEEQPHGYGLKDMPNQQQGDTARANRNRLLVTLDRVFGLDEDDMCFSFALFKLLRCRFAKYTISEAGFSQTSKFFRETLLQGDHYERVFGIIRDELSFINDYYYSSLPIYYSHPLLPAFGVTLSLWSIGYCLYLAGIMLPRLLSDKYFGQINCVVEFKKQRCGRRTIFLPRLLSFGSLYYDIVPLYLAIAVLVLAEAREIASYICSNWTKVALICHHVNQASCWQPSRVVQKCICSLFKYPRCSKLVNKLVNNWDDKIKQCSILVLRPRKTPLLLRRLLGLLDRGKKVELQRTVKDAIFKALKGESSTTKHVDDHGSVSYQCIGPPSTPVPLSLDDCISGRHPGYTILIWHIATSVFEARKPPQPTESDDKTVATHLSRYCAYLMTSRPELLPDDAEWCRKLYDEVKEDADRVLAKVQGVEDLFVHNLIGLLSADDSNHHEVLRNGARIGKELVDDPAMGWKKLASFWAQMILYVAPSENLEAHAEAISHGGELITVLWAMLAHAGITGRRLVDAAAEEGRGV